jgi:hypothetical protein
LRELQLELARQTAGGRATPCARQIFLEARWLTYSAQWQRIERRLHDLREMLQRPADPADARDQVEADGGYDHCSEAWFLRLDSTLEELEDRASRGFCLNETLNADGSFELMDEDTVGSSYMFPVELLDEAGYFRKSHRFWTDESFPGSLGVAKRVASQVQSAGLTDTESRKALRRLQDAQREAHRRRTVGALAAVALIGIGYLIIGFFRRGREPEISN